MRRWAWVPIAERLVAFLASIFTILGFGLALWLFRQEINDRIFARPLLTYELDTQGTTYFQAGDPMRGTWYYPAKWGMGYALVVRNKGREPALNVEIRVHAGGSLKHVRNNFASLGPLDPAVNVLRQEGGVGTKSFLYIVDRVRPRGTLVLSFSRQDECAVRRGPQVTVKYEDDKGTELEAEPEKPPRDFENVKAGRIPGEEVDCEAPSPEDVEAAEGWMPEMLYLLRQEARECDIQVQLLGLAAAMRNLTKEYPRPRDFIRGVGGVVCDRLRHVLKPAGSP